MNHVTAGRHRPLSRGMTGTEPMNQQDAAHANDTRADAPATPARLLHTRYEGISRSFRPFLSPRALVRSLWGNRALLHQLSKSRFSAGHREDILGIAWLVLEPLAMLAVYSLVFIAVFRVQWTDVPGGRLGAALNLYAGIVTYQIFAQSLGLSAPVVRGSRSTIKLMVFPTEVLPASVVGGLLVPALIGFVLIIVTMVAGGIGLSVTVLLLPVVLVPMFIMILGLAWLLSALCVFIPDVRTVTQIVIRFAFFLTPIVYPLTLVPEQFRWLLWLNPMTAILESVRAVLIRGVMPPWIELGIVTVVSLLVCQFGYAFFMRSKRAFADVV